jgi:XTP/dITP diphosphohydrolase
LIRLYCATGNPGKLREFHLAARHRPDVRIDLLPDFACRPRCLETGTTFEENAALKARHYGVYAPGPLFADDSGLEVDALEGAPGVFSARFAGPHATDEENNRLLLDQLRGIRERSAHFVCVIALLERQQVRLFRAAVEGIIAPEPRGSGGFGYDPLFYYPPFGCTFGQVPAQRKFTVSHRGQALRAMLESLG